MMVMVIWCVGVVGLFTPGVVVYPKAVSSANWKVGLKLAYDMTSILASVYILDRITWSTLENSFGNLHVYLFGKMIILVTSYPTSKDHHDSASPFACVNINMIVSLYK